MNIFETITERLVAAWSSGEPSGRKSVFTCRCERPVYFRNSMCLGCKAQLGYEPEWLQQVRSLTPVAPTEPAAPAAPAPAAAGTAAPAVPVANAGTTELWKIDGEKDEGKTWKRCANYDTPSGCNWLVAGDDKQTLCRSCRLNRTIPQLSDPDNGRWWCKIENAKRRLVSQLLNLGLPVASKVNEDPERGLMFDFLRSPKEGPRVLTGHANGLITLNVEEADDSVREKTRHEMREPYRTLLGHFRHEVGHYYWERLVDGTPWLEKFRELFGDDRQDYAAALKKNYEQGPPANWADKHISSYASVHPWEDWAETWAHYLHTVDSLDTALRFGLRGEDVEQEVEPFKLEDLYDPTAPDAKRVIVLINSWVQLSTVLNEFARSMGQHDYYPFVISKPVVRKMHFIQMIVKEAREGKAGPLEKL